MADYATYDEAAAMLRVSKYTIVRMVRDGRLTSRVTPRGYHRVLRSTIEDYAKEHRITNASVDTQVRRV
jgi:excisionase family DNA binding protein